MAAKILVEDEEALKSIAALFGPDLKVDFRDIKLKMTKREQVLVCQWFLWETYLSVASQTQFVEFCVKLLREVSQSGRREESRNVLAIIKHNLILGEYDAEDYIGDEGKEKRFSELSIPKKAEHILRTAIDHHNREQKKKAEDKNYESKKMAARKVLKDDHWINKRTEKKIATNAEKASKLRKMSVAQEKKGVDHTAAALQMIPYSSLKRIHIKFVREELLARKVPQEEVDGCLLISSLVDLLKVDEMKRVRKATVSLEDSSAIEHQIQIATKNFRQIQDGPSFETEKGRSIKPRDDMIEYDLIGRASEDFLREEMIARKFADHVQGGPEAQRKYIAKLSFATLKKNLKKHEVRRVDNKFKGKCSDDVHKGHLLLSDSHFVQLSPGPPHVPEKDVIVEQGERMVKFSSIKKTDLTYLGKEFEARGLDAYYDVRLPDFKNVIARLKKLERDRVEKEKEGEPPYILEQHLKWANTHFEQQTRDVDIFNPSKRTNTQARATKPSSQARTTKKPRTSKAAADSIRSFANPGQTRKGRARNRR